VHVTGNNYSPINIILELAASYLNWGVAGASSGDAQTSRTALAAGGGAARATSGAASATGLDVDQTINLVASAFVIIDGDNYAPIFIHIKFLSDVDNRGWAQASSGAAQAAAGTQLTNAAQPKNTMTTATGMARSGPAKVVGDSIRVTAVSQQIASANGQVIGDSAAPSTLSVSGVPSATSPAGAPVVPEVPSTTDLSGALPTNAVSGAATAMAPQLDVQTTNNQSSICLATEAACTASNSASLTVKSDPELISEPEVPTLPAAAEGGQPAAGTSRSGSGSRELTHTTNLQTTTITSTASGSRVAVDPFLVLAARRLPPLPDQPPVRSASGGLADQDPWVTMPSAGLPPLPDPDLSASDATDVAGAQIGTATVSRAPRAGGQTVVRSVAAAPTQPDLESQSPETVVDLNPSTPASDQPQISDAPGPPAATGATSSQHLAEVSDAVSTEPIGAGETPSEALGQGSGDSVAQPILPAEIAGAFGAALGLMGLLVWRRRNADQRNRRSRG
jgi:hypothetical protein